jgi:hypothetical protein
MSAEIARRELDALVAEIKEKLAAPADNPLLVIEQLRGRVLRFQERDSPSSRRGRFDKWLNEFQDRCDERHIALRGHPDFERWSVEFVAYERAEYQREKQQRENDAGRAP